MADKVTKSIIVKGKLDQVYDIWADFRNFPHFMENIESVETFSGDHSHWKMKGPLKTTLQWDAETTRMEKNQRIAWKSVSGDLQTSGQVTFKELPQDEIEITVTMLYIPPAGKLGQAVATIFNDPEKRLVQDLRNFKTYVEKLNNGGESVTNNSDSNPQTHTQKIKSEMDTLIEDLRAGVEDVDDPHAEALFETAAEVIGGLKTAFEHYENKSESAWR